MRTYLIAALLCAAPALATAQTPAARPDPLQLLPQDTIVAVVDGEVIRLSDLEAYSRTHDPKKLFQLNQQLFEFRESMLGFMLGERLLKLEADKAGTTVEELLKRQIKVEAVTDAEVQEILSRQPAGGLDRALVTPLVRQYLEDRKKEDARARYVAELVAKARKAPRPLVIRLEPPRQAVAIAGSDPTKGSGAVQIVEFSDFQCPFCQKLQPVLKEIMARFEGKVTHVWKDYPLPTHEFAIPAAVAARCAQEQGKFWEYHDLLFANQQALTPQGLKAHAGTLGMDTPSFNACVDGGKYRDQVAAALKAASAYPVAATPTVFINGRMITGVAPIERYVQIITDELAN